MGVKIGFDERESWDDVANDRRMRGLGQKDDQYWRDQYADGPASRGLQQEGLGYYRDMVEGNGPSVAEQQLRMGQDQGIANALAVQSRGRGGNMGAQARMGGSTAAGMQMQTNQQAAALRAQEQQAAMAGFAGMSNQMAQQDMGYDQMAGQMYLGQLGADDAFALQSRQLTLDEGKAQWDKWKYGLNKGFGALSSMGSAMMGMSDIRNKENIQLYGEGDRAALASLAEAEHMYGLRDPGFAPESDALASLGAATYNYKDPAAYGEGTRTGVMAQDLAANPATQHLVIPTPEGLAVDGAGLASMGVAASADQERRIRELEDEQRRLLDETGNDRKKKSGSSSMGGLGSMLEGMGGSGGGGMFGGGGMGGF